ncbi:MAG: class I SAM-dependent methyltransferase [Gammaproteobacteria bacterium]|nr:class I SAM-dependent methyltransferase [Gammaproteobacteria bacterium]
MSKQAGKDTSHWDDYWRHGALTSCADAFEGNYQGEIRRVWEEFFRSAEYDTTILDIGTGNGAIALIASQVAAELKRDFSIHAIDQAEIDPLAMLKPDTAGLATIHFHSKTAAENCGLPDHSVDMVSGQYALEYTPLEETVTELARVCAPGARLLFVMHHADSIVLETAAEELRLGGLLENSGFFDHAADLLQQMDKVPANKAHRLAADPKAEESRNLLNQAADELKSLASQTANPQILQTAMNSVSDCFQRQKVLGSQVLQLLAQYRQQLEANLARLNDLQKASVSDDNAREIVALFHARGFAAKPMEDIFHEHNLLAGRLLSAELPTRP